MQFNSIILFETTAALHTHLLSNYRLITAEVAARLSEKFESWITSIKLDGGAKVCEQTSPHLISFLSVLATLENYRPPETATLYTWFQTKCRKLILAA